VKINFEGDSRDLFEDSIPSVGLQALGKPQDLKMACTVRTLAKTQICRTQNLLGRILYIILTCKCEMERIQKSTIAVGLSCIINEMEHRELFC
jgi:hypothetical protein